MSFEDSTVRAAARQPSLSAKSAEDLWGPERPARLSIGDTAARTGASLDAVAPHLGSLPPATLRVYLAVLRQLPAWRRDAEAVDVAALAAASDTSTNSVYVALRQLTGAGALTWTATGPRSGIVGLPSTGHSPAPGRTWGTWAGTTAAATALIGAVLDRRELDDGEEAPEGWVVKRGACGVREASAPAGALRLATALLGATWPTQSPVVATTDIDTDAVGKPDAVRLAWRWLGTHAGVAYTPRPGRGLRGVGLPGHGDDLSGNRAGVKPPYADTAPHTKPPYADTAKPPYADTYSLLPGRSTQAPPTPRSETSAPTHQPDDGQGGQEARDQHPAPPAAAPTGEPVCMRPPDEVSLELALIVLGAIGAPAPATRQGTRSLMRRCAEPAGVLASFSWTAADVSAWLAADLRTNPVRQVRDPAALAGHLLGKAASEAKSGTSRPTAVKAARTVAAQADREAAQEHREALEAFARETAAVIAEALPHLAAMTPVERFALRPRKDKRRWAVDDFADLDRLHRSTLEAVCWTWHSQRCDDEIAAAGWDEAADFAASRGLSYLAEKLREDRAMPKMLVTPLRQAWCAAHHTHPVETTR